MMRKGLVLICVVAAALVPTGAVGASAVRVDPLEIAIPPTLETYYTDVCGFEVDWQLSGTVQTTLFLNRDGIVVRQVDVSPDMLYTLTAPAKGTELPVPSGHTVHYTYPEGATLGAPVEVAIIGMNDKHRGLPASAGLQLYSGHVTGFVGQVPQWEGVWGGAVWIDMIGHWNEVSQLNDVICTTLGST
jgi:hypothetical protein